MTRKSQFRLLVENNVEVEGVPTQYSLITVQESSVRILIESSQLMDERTCRKLLIDAGLNPNLPADFSTIFASAIEHAAQSTVKVAKRVGWHGDEYVSPNITMSPRQPPTWIHYSQIGSRTHNVPEALESNKLRTFIKKQYTGSAILTLVVCAAFAGPVLDLVDEKEGFCLYINGKTSGGKSTILRMAAALTQPVENREQKPFNFSSRANEEELFAHNDNVLCYDEIGSMDLRALPQLVYHMANGSGRLRSKAAGVKAEFPNLSWRTIVMISGEPSIKCLPDQERQSGQTARFISLRSPEFDAGGIFGAPNIRETRVTEKLVKKLEAICTNYDAADFKYWISLLVKGRAEIQLHASEKVKNYHDLLAPQKNNSLIRRIARKFAILAATGDLLAEKGIIEWDSQVVFRLIKILFEQNLHESGFSSAIEPEIYKGNVRMHARTLLSHAALGRFFDMELPNHQSSSLAYLGVIKKIRNKRFIAIYKDKINEAFDVRDSSLLIDELKEVPGLLLRNKRRNSLYCQIQHRLNGHSSRDNFLALRVKELAKLCSQRSQSN